MTRIRNLPRLFVDANIPDRYLVAIRLGFEFPLITRPQNVVIGQVICLALTCLLVSIAVLQYESTNSRLWRELQHERSDLEHLSRHDQLTGLPNRRHFTFELEQAMHRAGRNQCECALLFFDLNDFKAVNDRHGHGVGDELLKALARRLLDRFRSTDFVARWGGEDSEQLLQTADQAMYRAKPGRSGLDESGGLSLSDSRETVS